MSRRTDQWGGSGVVRIPVPIGRPMVADDLDAIEDELHRYEVIRGVLVVPPTPTTIHQGALAELMYRLHRGCRGDLSVMLRGPVRLAPDTEAVLEPFVTGDEPVEVIAPFPLRFSATELIEDMREILADRVTPRR